MTLPLAYQGALSAIQMAVRNLKWDVHEKSEMHLVCRFSMGWSTLPGRVEVHLDTSSNTETKVKLSGFIPGWGPIQANHLRTQMSKLGHQVELAVLTLLSPSHERISMKSAHTEALRENCCRCGLSVQPASSSCAHCDKRFEATSAHLYNEPASPPTRWELLGDWRQLTWRSWTALAIVALVMLLIVAAIYQKESPSPMASSNAGPTAFVMPEIETSEDAIGYLIERVQVLCDLANLGAPGIMDCDSAMISAELGLRQRDSATVGELRSWFAVNCREVAEFMREALGKDQPQEEDACLYRHNRALEIALGG